MSWTALRRRSDVLRDVVDHLDRLDPLDPRTGASLPWDRPGVAETFHDRLDLVGALQLRWSARLSARLDDEAARRPDDRDAAVRRAWAATARELPGVRAVLDRQVAAPETEEIARALVRASADEHALLALAAGRAGDAGRVLEAEARAAYRSRAVRSAPAPQPVPQPVPQPAVGRVPAGSAAFVERLKAALAAA